MSAEHTSEPTALALGALTDGLPIWWPAGAHPGARELTVSAVTHDSRRVSPGTLFVAWRGQRHDGRDFVANAIALGAVAVLTDGEPLSTAPEQGGETAFPWLTAATPRALLGPLAARLYGHPQRELLTLGVTGTNGKSTTIALLAAIAEAAGLPCGLVGTLGSRFRDLVFAGERTTPEGNELIAAFAAMRQAGAKAVAMEVSSHALDQGRVAGIDFDLAAFTNLTRDHFDQHGDFATYFAAKRRLFTEHLAAKGAAVVHLDEETAAGGDERGGWGRRLADELAERFAGGTAVPPPIADGKRLLRFAVQPTADADLMVSAQRLDRHGIRATISTPRGTLEVTSPLLGGYNLENILTAVAGAEALGFPHQAITSGLAAVQPLPGRLEPVDLGQPFLVVIDYAHTPAALEAALRSVRAITGGKLAVVFGCGGDRDPSKRAPMGRLAGELADLPVATSDNPRQEDPIAILREVERGLLASGNPAYRIVPDRREAIRRTVSLCGPGWALVVAGKGHETAQLVAGQRLPFSDRHELEQALAEHHGHAHTR